MSRDIFLVGCSYSYLISENSTCISVIVRKVQSWLGIAYTASIFDAAALERFYFISS